ncbi:hypothetical protein RHCRD62_50005 [Rhodococcus sp. RD6.2]|nr:hypothetical protein RHCRD62_50005 [Rhodococcus sp. RD6.2]
MLWIEAVMIDRYRANQGTALLQRHTSAARTGLFESDSAAR